MPKNPRKLPCTCGHEFGLHYSFLHGILAPSKRDCYVHVVGKQPFPFSPQNCSCPKFQLDNLKYIEWLAKKRKLV